MVKWGIRSSRGKEKTVSSYHYKDQAKGRGGKSSRSNRRGYDKREYDNDDGDDDGSYYSQQSSDLDEEGGRAGDYRDDKEAEEEVYDGEEEDEADDDFEADENDDPEGRMRPPNRQRELVTRDQVLGELRAQAAADALGKSLEQMGYNLDNCDSFYSLSDQENAVDQRYMIQSQPSADLTRSSAKKPRPNNKKSKKKKNKKVSSAHSRCTAASDDEDGDEEEESTVMYGRSYRGDFEETYADSFTEMSDEFTYGDESSFATGISSRFTRLKKPSGKKTMRKQRAATIKSKKHRTTKRSGGGRDNETYYTRDGESSYGRTIDESSTISSVSSRSDDDDALTEYTEPTCRGGRRMKKAEQKQKRRGGGGRRRGGAAAMRAIEEEKDFGRSSSNCNRLEPLSKRAAEIMKRNDSDRFSGSSQIGAMRSIDSFMDNDNVEDAREQDTGTTMPIEKEKSAPKKNAKKSSANHIEEDKTSKKSSRKHRKLPSDESLYSDQESTDNKERFDANEKHIVSESDDKKTVDEQRDEEDGSLSGNESFSDGESEEDVVSADKKPETANDSKDAKKSTKKEAPSMTMASFWPKQFMSLRGKKKTAEVLHQSEKAKPASETSEAHEEKRSSSFNETPSVQLIDDVSQKDNDKCRVGIVSPPRHSRKEGSDASLIPELLKSQDSESLLTTKKDNDNPDPKSKVTPDTTQAGTSIGLLEVATMAALIPLAPFAAAYSCYTADTTQSLIKSANCTDTACAEPGTPNNMGESDNHTRSTTKSRPNKKKRSSKLSRHGVRPVNSNDPSLVSSKSRRSQKSRNSKSKEMDVPVDTQMDFTSIIGTKDGVISNEAPPTTRIQEEQEGFESFLPGSLESQTQAESVASSLKKQAKGKQRSKRWLPKLRFRSHKKKSLDDNAGCVADTEKARDSMPPLPVNNAALEMPAQYPSARVPSTLPKLKMNRKNSAGVDSTKALQSFYAETPTSTPEMIVENEIQNTQTPEGNLRGFDSSTGSNSVVREGSDVAKHPANERKSKIIQNKSKNKNKNKKEASGKEDAKFDPATATEEELLKYYDLGQTLSEVIDARETLEHAYGKTSGGASFDDTIDEQLVELLTHMAEMDQDDAVEIEAAIKKLKKHARKLGISERDLLFSAKSAEEGTMANPPVPQRKIRAPSPVPAPVAAPAPKVGFGDKVLDAFEGYFGRT